MKPTVRIWNLLVALTLLFGAAFAAPAVRNVQAISPDVVISQVYGGGGNSGAPYTHDFVELYNRGTSTVSLEGWSIQYASATGTGAFGANSGQLTPLSGSIAPGQYKLIQEAGGTIGVALPTPDITDATPIAMAAAGGKVALVNTAISIGCNGGSILCTASQLAAVVDLVGYGSANFFEGSGAAPTLSNTTAAFRNSNGCVDTDNNTADFSAGAPAPRNSASPVYACPVEIAPAVSLTVPSDFNTLFANDGNITVEFSEPVNVTDGWFSISCAQTGEHSAVVTGGPATFTLDPDTDFSNEICALNIFSDLVSDQDLIDPPDNLAKNVTVNFFAGDACVASYTSIPEIQSAGSAVLLENPLVTQGVVVGDFEGAAPNLRGFFIQDLTGDGDPATSDGIFVFEFDNANRVSLGDVVSVIGTPGENQGQSQVSSNAIVVCGTGSVEPTDVEFPVPSADYLEQYEGMLVRLPDVMYVTEHFQLGRFGQVVVSSDARLAQPTNVVSPGADALALQAANNLNRIIIDDASQVQNPDPILFSRDGTALSASNTLRGGDTITGAVGVMTYTWAGNSASGNAYRLRPIQALNGYWDFEPTNPRPEAPAEVSGTLRVGALNVLNYFNTFDGLPDTVNNCTTGVGGAPTDCRGADTQTEFDRQVPKTVTAIVKMNVDVLGIMEIENDGYGPSSAIAHLVDQLNAATAPGTYAFIDADAATGQINALGTDAIKVGFLYKPAVVTPVGQTAVLNTVSFVTGGDGEARNRPALAQAFQQNSSSARFVAVVNHLKSKGSACDLPDQVDGQGNCSQVRTNAALEEAAWLASNPTGTGEQDVLILGDLNSYAMEDPIMVFEEFWYTNLMSTFLGPDAYGYVFDGQWGYLDHALASQSLFPQVTGIAEYHINADEPSVLDYNTDFKSDGQILSLYAPDEFRVSDHDPVIIGLNLTAETLPSEQGFATGGGWVKANVGTFFYDLAWTGKAQFAFDAKYKKENLMPEGPFSLVLEDADFTFTSDPVDWLWVNPGFTQAILSGVGTGTHMGAPAEYRFIAWMVDGKRDDIRIQIWDGTQLVFDNGYLQRLSGNVQIHP